MAAVLIAAAPLSSNATPAPTAPTAPAEAQPPPVRLFDVGPALGFPSNTHSWDLVVGRIDADAIPDLVVADHARVQVWLNRRPGLEAGFGLNLSDPHGCAIGDVDGNALGDIYCTMGAGHGSGRGFKRLFLQPTEGTWVQRAPEYGVSDEYGRGRRTTFADLDHEGGLDLVVGNEAGRVDGELSVNRTFLQTTGPPMTDQRLGPIGDKGSVCLQAVDYDRDGWQDLLLCGGTSGPEPESGTHPSRLYLFRNQTAADGGRRLVGVAGRLGVALGGVRSARIADLNRDRFLDLVVVTDRQVAVRPGTARGFGPPTYIRDIRAGNWVAVGNIDGRPGNDIFVVQGCRRSGNVRDLLLLQRAGGQYQEVQAPLVGRGCGDTATTLDIDGDGAHEVVVGNGRWSTSGPLQVLTTGRWRGGR